LYLEVRGRNKFTITKFRKLRYFLKILINFRLKIMVPIVNYVHELIEKRKDENIEVYEDFLKVKEDVQKWI
jgi:hypothetical protein